MTFLEVLKSIEFGPGADVIGGLQVQGMELGLQFLHGHVFWRDGHLCKPVVIHPVDMENFGCRPLKNTSAVEA